MNRTFHFAAVAAVLLSTPAFAQPTINVGTVDLQPDLAGQQVQVTISGTENIGGLEFFAQVGDGSSGPVITGVDLITGTIFEADNFGQFDLGGTPRNAAASTSVFFDAVPANGLLATLTLSTVGITSPGQFGLTLSSTGLGDTQLFDLQGDPVAAIINDGTLNIVPEPTTALLLGAGGLALLRRRGYQGA